MGEGGAWSRGISLENRRFLHGYRSREQNPKEREAFMVFSFPAFFISEVNFFQILKFLPISTYTLYIVLARVHKISIFQSYLLIVFQNLFNYHSYWWHLCVCYFTQSCPTLCDPMDGGLPGSSVHGILQAGILRWVAMPFSRGSSQPRY